MVFTRMFLIQPAAASCTRSSSEPVNVSKVCWKQRKKNPTSQFERIFLYTSLHTRQVAHQVEACPDFCGIKRLGVFLLPPGWEAGLSQGYPMALNLYT